MTWRTETVGTLCDRFGGEVQTGPFGSQLHASDYQDEGTPVVMPQDLIDGRISTRSIAKVGQSHVLRMPQHVLRRGDIVFSRRGDVARFAIVNEREEGWICGTGCLRIRLNSHEVLSDYLRHFLSLSSTKAWLEHHSRGVTMANTNTSTLRELPLRYPSVDVQRRICSILDKADAIRRKRQEAIALTEQLLRSTFLEMFGDPVTNPKGWPWVSMDEIIRETQYGTSAKANEERQGIPVLRMNNLTNTGGLDLSDIKWCEIAPEDLAAYTVERGDLLFNRTNSPALVGKTAVWTRDEPYAFAGYLVRVRFDESRALSHYVSGFLNSDYGKRMLFAMQKTSNNMSNISASDLRRVRLPLPSIDEQRRYHRFVEAIVSSAPRRHDALAQADTLFHSLVQRAFSGQL